MKYLAVMGKMILALAFGFCLLLATADDPEIVALDLSHPTTLLSLVANRVYAVHAYVRDFQLSELLAGATAGFRERTRQESPTPTPLR